MTACSVNGLGLFSAIDSSSGIGKILASMTARKNASGPTTNVSKKVVRGQKRAKEAVAAK